MGKSVKSSREKSLFVDDNTIQAKGLSNVFERCRKLSTKAVKKLLTKVIKNPGRTIEIRKKNGSAATFKNPKEALSTISFLKKFFHTGKRLYIGILVRFLTSIYFLEIFKGLPIGYIHMRF